MHVATIRLMTTENPSLVKKFRNFVHRLIKLFHKNSLTWAILVLNRSKTQTAVTNICLNCITFMNLTFRMLQQTSDMHCKIKESLLIRDLKPALNENVGSETSSLLLAYSCRFMSINFVSSQSAQLYF